MIIWYLIEENGLLLGVNKTIFGQTTLCNVYWVNPERKLSWNAKEGSLSSDSADLITTNN